jgi:hypothetical protein
MLRLDILTLAVIIIGSPLAMIVAPLWTRATMDVSLKAAISALTVLSIVLMVWAITSLRHLPKRLMSRRSRRRGIGRFLYFLLGLGSVWQDDAALEVRDSGEHHQEEGVREEVSGALESA